MGIGIALDDFGTGYSSLEYLKRLPIDRLKIDRSFVKDIMVNKDDAAITRTIIAMARNLNLRVIAEGAEDVDQFNFLKSEGCHEFQGYALAKPISPEEVIRMVKQAQIIGVKGIIAG